MQITIILKQKLESLPPVSNLIDCLIDLGVDVNLICTGIERFNQKRYSEIINIEIFPEFNYRLLKVISLVLFRKRTYRFLKKNTIGQNVDSIVWLGSAEASLGVGHKIKNYKFVFQSHELYDTLPFYKIQNRFYYQNSIINVCPEMNRAAIIRYWYKLKQTPSLLVNSPYHHPLIKSAVIENDEAANAINNLKGKKIILYMGQVSPERDITAFAKAIDLLGEHYHLLVMGAYIPERDYIQNILRKYKNITFINGLPSPTHLQVTSWAYIGILSYSFSSLNNVFCAPNKIWEYSGFGIPMISNDIPGIQTLLNKYNSGITLNTENENVEEIIESIYRIDLNYQEMSENSKIMFEEAGFKSQVENILKKIKK